MIPAEAAEGDTSFARARFLSGDVLGMNLDKIAELSGAEAVHTGDGAPVTEANPLTLKVLETTLIDIPGGIQVPLSDIIELGAVNQYATAGADGVAGAGAGAVADNGAIGTGTDAGFPASATFHLADLLGDDFTDAIADVDLYTEDVSAEAHVGAAPTTDYKIAELELGLGVPALGEIVSSLENGAGDVEAMADSLVSSDGELTKALSAAAPLTNVTSTLGVDAEVTAAIDVDLSGTIAHLCDNPLGEGTPVEIDLCEGTVVVDLDSLTDGAISDMPANTEVLSKEVIDALAANTGEILDRLVEDVVELLEAAVLDSDVSLGVKVDGAVAGTVDLSVDATVREIINGEANVVDNSSGLARTVSGLVGKTSDAVLPAAAGALEPLVASVGTDGLGSDVAAVVADVTEALDPALDDLNRVLSVKVNAQGDQAPSEAGVADLLGGLDAQESSFLPSGLLPAADTPDGSSSGTTAVQAEVLDGDGATVNLASVEAGSSGGDGDDSGDETGDDSGADDGAEAGADGNLPNTGGGAPTWLLAAGAALMVIGGGTAFAVNRRNRLTP